MTYTLSEGVLREIRAQQVAVDARCRATQMYLDEPASFSVAAAAYEAIAAVCGVVEDRGTRTSGASRHLVRQVLLRDGSSAVLKVDGGEASRGEAQALTCWRSHGLPCVEPLRSGHHAGATYLLTALADGDPLQVLPLQDPEPVLVALLQFVQQFHLDAASPSLRCARTWEERIWLHLRWALPLLEQAGVQLPDGWVDKLHTWSNSTEQQYVLHGDVAPANVLQDEDGRLLLLDPRGWLRGPREADVGHLCVTFCGDLQPLQVAQMACTFDPTLRFEVVCFFAGVQLFTVAAHVLAGSAGAGAGPSPGSSLSGTVQAWQELMGVR